MDGIQVVCDRSLPVRSAQLDGSESFFQMESDLVSPWLLQLLERERHWLEKQPGMNPWLEGCAVIENQLNDFLLEYTRTHCAVPIGDDHPDRKAYLRRLWGAWNHHWRQTAEEGKEGRNVAEQIRQGRGFTGKGCLGGDPLRDVVIAEAVVRKDAIAMHLLEEEYRVFSISLAMRVNRRVAEDLDDWWYRFLDDLGGFSNPPGKLSKFGGYCGLKNWIGTAAKFFARRYPPRIEQFDGEIEDGGDTGPIESAGEEEAIEPLAALLSEALEELTAQQRLILWLRFAEGLANKEVAAILGIDKGRVSHREKAAVNRLKKTVERLLADRPPSEECEESRRALSDPDVLMRFALEFCEQLREILSEEERSGIEEEAQQ